MCHVITTLEGSEKVSFSFPITPNRRLSCKYANRASLAWADGFTSVTRVFC